VAVRLFRKLVRVIPKILLYPIFKILEIIEDKYLYKENKLRKKGKIYRDNSTGEFYIQHEYFKWQKKKLSILLEMYRVGSKVVITDNVYVVRVIGSFAVRRTPTIGKNKKESLFKEVLNVYYV